MTPAPRRSRMNRPGLPNRIAAAAIALLLAIPVVQGCAVLERLTDGETTSLDGIPPVEGRGADWPVLPREGGEDGHDDPFEDVNQVFFYFNGALDFLFLEPIAQFYRGMMPTERAPCAQPRLHQSG